MDHFKYDDKFLNMVHLAKAMVSDLNLMIKTLITILLVITSSLHAAELESLKQFTNRKPSFISNKVDTQFVATRCSALYLVLSSRTEEASKEKALKAIAKDYADRAVTYDQVRDIFAKAISPKDESSKNLENEFAKKYSDITLRNWKQSNDLFKGIVNEDLDVCRDNYPYFKKLATNLSKDIKK